MSIHLCYRNAIMKIQSTKMTKGASMSALMKILATMALLGLTAGALADGLCVKSSQGCPSLSGATGGGVSCPIGTSIAVYNSCTTTIDASGSLSISSKDGYLQYQIQTTGLNAAWTKTSNPSDNFSTYTLSSAATNSTT